MLISPLSQVSVFGDSAQPWGSYWKQQLNLLATGRSGLTIPATTGVSPNILLPYYKRITNDYLAYVNDNGGLDIGINDFTLCGWFNTSGISAANNKGIVGKGLNGGTPPAGWYGIFAANTTNYLYASIQTSNGVVTIASNISADSSNWFFYRIDINQTTSKFRFFLNGTQIGSDSSFTGTFPSLDNKYRFYFGCCNATADGNASIPGIASFSDNYVFHRLLTDNEALSLLNRGFVTGATAHWALTSPREGYDLSSNAYHLTFYLPIYELYVTQGFSAYGSRQSLEKGYSLYTKDLFKDFFVPYGDDGNPLSSPSVPSGYTFVKNVAGISNGHNLCDSMIEFSGSEWDRSDASRSTSQARIAPTSTLTALTYYLSSNPKAWHISELNRFVMDYYFNPDYQYQAFANITNNSETDRLSLKELFSYPSKQTGKKLYAIFQHTSDQYNLIKSTGNPIIASSYFGSVVYVDSTHYILYYSNTTNILRALSSDGISFTPDTPNNPVLTGGSVCNVWIEGNTWYMLYRYNPGPYSIGLATSSDGITWTPYASNPVLAGTAGQWDAPPTGIDPWGLIKVGTTYYLFFNNIGTNPRSTGLATSTDLINWTKDANNPIFTTNRYCASVFKYSSYYYMIIPKMYSFGGYEPNKYYQRIELYRDINPTFYASDRQYLGILQYQRSCDVNISWDWEYPDTPMVLTTDIQKSVFPDNKIRMYYTGRGVSAIWYHGLSYGDLDMIANLPALIIPFTPINLTASVNSSSSITINFLTQTISDPITTTGFYIQRSMGDESNYQTIHTNAAGVLSFADSGLNGSTKYYYRVCAFNTLGQSTYCSSVNATTSVYVPYDAASIAYFARMVVQPNDATKTLIDTFIKARKADGSWNEIDAGCLYGYLPTEQAGLLNIKGDDTLNHSTVGSPTWTAKQGYTIIVGSYIRSNFIASTNGVKYTLNNAGVFREVLAVGVGGFDGCFDTAGDLFGLALGFPALSRINNAAAIACTFSVGFNGLTRTDASNALYRDGDTEATVGSVSTALSTLEYYIGRCNNAGVYECTNAQYKSYWFSSSMTKTMRDNLKADLITLYAAIQSAF